MAEIKVTALFLLLLVVAVATVMSTPVSEDDGTDVSLIKILTKKIK